MQMCSALIPDTFDISPSLENDTSSNISGNGNGNGNGSDIRSESGSGNEISIGSGSGSGIFIGSGSGSSIGSGSGSSTGSGSGEDNNIQYPGKDLAAQYLDRPVQFIVINIGNFSANTAPRLLLPDEPLFVVEEDVISNYQLEFEDAEGDEVNFYIATPPSLGTAELTLDGQFSYTPCMDCTGMDRLDIYIVEKPFGFNNVPLTSSGTLFIEIENINDSPLIYAYDPLSHTPTDVTPDLMVQVYIESNRTAPVSVVHVAALDRDGYLDNLIVSTQDGNFGSANSEVWLNAVNVIESLPITSLPGNVFQGYVTFVAANITYLPHSTDFIGSDIIQVLIRDHVSALSGILRINVTVLPSWCQNNGVCGGSAMDSNCTDIESRRRDPGSYSCNCSDEFSGQFCEIDLQTMEPEVTRGMYDSY